MKNITIGIIVVIVAVAIAFVAATLPGQDAQARTVESMARIEEARKVQVEEQERTERERIAAQSVIDRAYADVTTDEMARNGDVVRRLALEDTVARNETRRMGTAVLALSIVTAAGAASYAYTKHLTIEHRCAECTYAGCDRSATSKALKETRQYKWPQ